MNNSDFESKIKATKVASQLHEDLAYMLEGYQAAADNALSIVLDSGELDIVLNAFDILLAEIKTQMET